MRTQLYKWPPWVGWALLLGLSAAQAQFSASTKLGSGATGLIRTNTAGSYSVIAGGQDMWSAGDQFTFHNFPAQGQFFDMRARVQSLEPNARLTRAGLMVRENLTGTNSRMALVRVTPVGTALNGETGANDVRFQYRLGTASPAQGEHEEPTVGFPAPAYPNAWVRLERHGSVIGAYSSTDGNNWLLLGNEDTATWPAGPFQSSVFFLGLAQSRHPSGAKPTNNVEYRNFTTAGNYPPIISELGNVSTPEDTPTAALAFTIGDFETTASGLTVTAGASNPTLFPAGSLVLGGAGTNRTLMARPATNAFGNAILTVTTSDGVRTASEQFQVVVTPVNDAPTMTAIANQTVNEDGTLGPIAFSIADVDSPITSLAVNGFADNATLVPTNNITFGGAGSSRTVTVQPAPNLSGTTRITIRVSDGAATGGIVFTLTVVPVNDPPTISDLPDQVIAANSSTPALPFTIFDVDTPATGLALTGNSDNLTLVPLAGIVFGTGAARTVTVTPAPDRFGTANISVTVSDGTGSATDTFKVTVNPAPPVITEQPQSQTVEEGGRAVFTVAATGTPPLAFQWYFSGQPIDGAKDNVHVLPAVQVSNAGNYTVVVANPAGSATSSPPAVLTVQGLDFGDAPDRPYPTLLGNNGARHLLVQGVFLGARVDSETNGQPNLTATGDDDNPTTADDEDGVRFLGPLIPGQPAVIEVTASVTGRLDAWVDFGVDGSWAETGDKIFSSRLLAPGPNTLAFVVPAAAKVGPAFARFRFSLLGDLNFIGQASSGEVEDYRVEIEDRPLDFGDAPQSYRTLLADDGARHLILPGFHLGVLVDSEPDGQPSPDALGDDKPSPAGGPDDEDGVVFATPLIPGQPARVEVLASTSGRLDAWIDFDADGTFGSAIDQIFVSEPVVTGLNTLSFDVPTSAVRREVFARFRFSREGGLKPEGLAGDGEVEDYRVDIEDRQLDFGDAPQVYPTLASQNGARHQSSQLRMGGHIDLEPDGQPSGNAEGDDSTPAGGLDDEDGVKFLTPLLPGQPAQVEVTVNISCHLEAWIDFNLNGSWADASDRIFFLEPLSSGANVLTFIVPTAALARESYARFRVSSRGGLSFTGFAPDGEVEDYQVKIEERQLDFGDAPENYPVILANNGARHLIEPGFHLGQRVDAEPNGQPSADALGDDGPAGAADDEDGVRFLTPLIPGNTAQVEVTASAPGILNTWVDFNLNGSWADAGEQVFVDVPLAAGPNTLSFAVPASSTVPRPTYIRFRFSHEGKIGFAGFAPDGEVEDYRVEQGRPPECDQDCSGTNFWLAFPGNYAPDTNNPPRLSLCIVGTPGTAFQVTIPGLGFAAALAVPAGGAALVPLPAAADLGESNDVITKKGIHVVAAGPVSVQALNHVRYTSDGYLGLPASTLGTEYLIASFANVHSGAPDLNGSQFAIAACEDNTRVRITPRIAIGSHPANVSFVIELQAGETYQLRATNDAPADLTGTLIESDRPVAVFGSHQCANVPSSGQWFCDYIVEMLLPTARWGRAFLTCPLATRLNGDTFRILASVDDTLVSINAGAPITIDRGEYHQVNLTAASTIVASQPVSVMQYANSSDFDLVTDSDPFMVIVPPVSMFNPEHMVCTAPVDFTAHYLNVIAPAAAVGGITTNGVVVPAAAFSPIGATAFVCAQLPVGVGLHRVASPQPVGVTVYGWGEYDSYGYPGCLALGDSVPPTITCLVSNVTVALGTPGTTPNCVVQVPDFRSQVQFSDNCGLSPNTVPRQVPPPGTTVGPGVHPVTITVTDANGNSASCVITLTVVDRGAPILQCSNLVARCTTSTGAEVRYSVSAHTLCGTPVPVQCTPPPGSFFPLGVTQVSCVASNGGQLATCVFTVKVECDTVGLTVENGVLVVTWSDGTLESAPTPSGPWTPVPNATSPLRVVPTTTGNRFFRVRF